MNGFSVEIFSRGSSGVTIAVEGKSLEAEGDGVRSSEIGEEGVTFLVYLFLKVQVFFNTHGLI